MITAGPTREAMDPVRFLSNASSGAVGIEIANAAQKSGAKVILILGPTHLSPLPTVKTIRVVTAVEMNSQVKKYLNTSDIFIASAAVGDWRFKNPASQKIKKGQKDQMHVALVRNPDILGQAGVFKKRHKNLILVGFALETRDQIHEARKKLVRKNLDLIVANDPRTFASEKIKSTWIDRYGDIKKQALLNKSVFAKKMLGWISRYEH